MRDQVAIVTGGARGIGRACAERFARAGMHLVVADLSGEDAERVCDVLRDEQISALPLEGDVADPTFCRQLAEVAMKTWGRIDVLVANAARRNFSRLMDTTEEEWDAMVAVNLKGTAFCCQAVLPHMVEQQQGAIVLISSVHYLVGRCEMPIYDATKAGIVSLARSMAIDHAADGIRVNTVCPGFTVTDFHVQKAIAEGVSVDSLRQRKVSPLQRPADPAEIASAVFFLASPDASYITGQALMVDGGRSIC